MFEHHSLVRYGYELSMWTHGFSLAHAPCQHSMEIMKLTLEVVKYLTVGVLHILTVKLRTSSLVL